MQIIIFIILLTVAIFTVNRPSKQQTLLIIFGNLCILNYFHKILRVRVKDGGFMRGRLQCIVTA